MDWATLVEEEERQQQQEREDEAKQSRDDMKLDSVMVASCSDDGTLRVWRPTLVCAKCLFSLSVLYRLY